MLKLYIYGYLNRSTARKLKRTVMAVTLRLGKIRKRERQTKMASMSVNAGRRGL